MAHVVRTTSDNAGFQNLVKLLDMDLAIRDGDEHSFYSQYNKLTHVKHVVVYYTGHLPVACGAFKAFDDKTAEIKRMYVLPDSRGRGIAALVLRELEQWAAELNYTSCILETGKKQPEAIRLYEKAGYTVIPNYAQYEGVENSVCMRKEI